jgi:tetratricopeptide (TPR) repeat protein
MIARAHNSINGSAGADERRGSREGPRNDSLPRPSRWRCGRAQNRSFLKARIAVAGILAKAATGQGEWAQLPPRLRKVFTDETEQYYRSLLQEGSNEPAARFETAVGYRSLAFLHLSAPDYPNAEKYYRKAIEMLEALVKESGNNVDYRHQLASSNVGLATSISSTTRAADVKQAYETAASLYEQLFASNQTDAEFYIELRKCCSGLTKLNPGGMYAAKFDGRASARS